MRGAGEEVSGCLSIADLGYGLGGDELLLLIGAIVNLFNLTGCQ